MLRRVLSLKPRVLPRIPFRFASQYPTELVSYSDPAWFSPEAGPIQKSIYGDSIEIPRCRIDQYIWANSGSWQDKTAVACGVTGKSYTFAQLRDRVAAFAINLQKFGLQRNDVVGICMPNRPEFILAALGIIEAGAVATTYNTLYTPEETARQIIHSNTKLMICLVENYAAVQAAVQHTKRDIKIVVAKIDPRLPTPPGAIDFYEWEDSLKVDFSSLKTFDFDLSDTGALLYSSGTTGLPKAVELSHRNLIANSIQLNTNTVDFLNPTTSEWQDVLLCILPLFHAYAWNAIFTSRLAHGAKIVTLPNFKPETFVRAIHEHKVTLLNVVPSLIQFLGFSDLVTAQHLASLRRIGCGAASLGVQEAAPVLKKAPQVSFGQGYGMTETTCIALSPVHGAKNYGSPGFPVAATQVKVVALDDPNLTPLAAETTGELLVRGPQVMKGYLRDEKATSEMLIGNGWLRTGDLGYYNEQGEFYITGRVKELIKVHAFQVAPAELEEVLRTHPTIADAAVVGVPHPKTGEVPRAFVIARPNQKVDQEEVLKFLKQQVAEFKLPDSIVVTDAIPKNASGKILRRQIKLQYGIIKE